MKNVTKEFLGVQTRNVATSRLATQDGSISKHYYSLRVDNSVGGFLVCTNLMLLDEGSNDPVDEYKLVKTYKGKRLYRAVQHISLIRFTHMMNVVNKAINTGQYDYMEDMLVEGLKKMEKGN